MHADLIFQRATTTSDVQLDASTTSDATSSTNDTPFFSSPASSGSTNPQSSTSKMVLEWVVLVVVLLVIGMIVAWRFVQLRRMNIPLSRFFCTPRSRSSSSLSRYNTRSSTIRTLPRTTGLPLPLPASRDNQDYYYPYYPELPALPPAHHRPRIRTRAADIGVGGRRLGGEGIVNDYDGLMDDKDILPAYDTAGGPPKYIDLEMQARLFGIGTMAAPIETDRPPSFHDGSEHHEGGEGGEQGEEEYASEATSSSDHTLVIHNSAGTDPSHLHGHAM